ncbi:hypothetical protein KKI93_09160 [Xenorhabdus bovienii]|nr:hypothetical protein [Xenorhabdus bovienii]MDE9503786.1 hypothetical protein [Xenorhabdus bovienii]MDE9527535.1 hypothetical protein [Xenorhabdus bovienii]MDE9564235.1 hypothetical protein [Xenorhabdus bovienii]MDE9570695.1 hypothetical protein [Xenorhabdus bovienii]
MEEARFWIDNFIRYYNEEHRHRGIHYVTPSQRLIRVLTMCSSASFWWTLRFTAGDFHIKNRYIGWPFKQSAN